MTNSDSLTIKCSLCGFEFKEESSRSGCSGCFLAKGCSLVRCPNCGFEMAPEPEWARKFKRKVKE